MKNHDNTINFLYWLYNYETSISETFYIVFGKSLGKHFYEKFQQFNAGNYHGDVKALYKTIMAMTDDNKAKLLDWIDRNYNGYSHLDVQANENRFIKDLRELNDLP